jgi:hypothetical protein
MKQQTHLSENKAGCLLQRSIHYKSLGLPVKGMNGYQTELLIARLFWREEIGGKSLAPRLDDCMLEASSRRGLMVPALRECLRQRPLVKSISMIIELMVCRLFPGPFSNLDTL